MDVKFKLIPFTILGAWDMSVVKYFIKNKRHGIGECTKLCRLEVLADEDGPYFAMRCEGNIVEYMNWIKRYQDHTEIYLGWN